MTAPGVGPQLPPVPAQSDAAGHSPTEDDLDKDQLDQLHAATLKASDACFEMKKICAALLVPTGTLVALLSDRVLNPALFVAPLAVIIVFWLADAVSFYYQRKLRDAMAGIWLRRARRCDNYPHVPAAAPMGPIRALFNGSMAYYFALIALVVIAFLLYGLGLIHPAERSLR